MDHRRRNRSLESLQENANRLKAYKANLVGWMLAGRLFTSGTVDRACQPVASPPRSGKPPCGRLSILQRACRRRGCGGQLLKSPAGRPACGQPPLCVGSNTPCTR